MGTHDVALSRGFMPDDGDITAVMLWTFIRKILIIVSPLDFHFLFTLSCLQPRVLAWMLLTGESRSV